MDKFETDPVLKSYVHDVSVLENTEAERSSNLPFHADGYPGIIFSNTPNGKRRLFSQGRKTLFRNDLYRFRISQDVRYCGWEGNNPMDRFQR